MGKKRADVQAAEKTLKSVLNTSMSKKNFELYDVPKDGGTYEAENARGYFYVVAGGDDKIPDNDPYIDVVEEVFSLYPDYNLGFWQDNVDKKYYPTKELQKLMTDKGYPFLRLSRGFYIYYNSTAKKAYFVGISKYSEKMVLNIHLAIIDLGGKNSSLSALRSGDYKGYFKALDKETYARDRVLDRIVDRIQKSIK